MSANYYLKRDVCPCCGAHKQKLHIGLAAYGWYFGLRIYEEEDLPKSLADWEMLFKEQGSEIVDEYGDDVDSDRMLAIITTGYSPIPPEERIRNRSYSLQAFLDFNSAEIGKHNLLRRRINDVCTGHGPDDLPYDLVIKEID